MRSLKRILLFVFSLSVSFCFSQADTVKDAKFDEILSRLKGLEENESQHIGTISFSSSKHYSVYLNKEVIRTIKVDSIKIRIVNGYAEDVVVYSKDIKFTNKQAPIALTADRMIKKDALFSITGDIAESVIYQEVLNVSLDNNFVPEDGNILLNKTKPLETLQCSVGINTVLDIRLYSDALGLIGGQSNGLAQTDIKFKQIVHRKNIYNTGFGFAQYFKLNLNISKFDSKDKYTDSVNFSRAKLLQKSYASTEMRWNVINGWLGEKKSSHSYYFDLGGGVNASRLSKHKDSITTDIILPYWFIETGINLRVSENIGTEAQVRYFKQYLAQNNFTKEKGVMEFYKFSAEIYYNPVGKRASRMFARVNYNLIGNRKDEQNSFFQFQVGYSVQLTKLINK